MKVKTSITMSEDVLSAVDQLSVRLRNNRSELIETAVRAYIAQLLRAERNARDLEIIDQNADGLNEEAMDVLEYQVIP